MAGCGVTLCVGGWVGADEVWRRGAGQALPEPYVPGSGDRLPADLRLAVLALDAFEAGNRFSTLLRRPSDPHRATVMASKDGGRTLILDIWADSLISDSGICCVTPHWR